MRTWFPAPTDLWTDLRLLTAPPEVQALVYRLAGFSQGGRVPCGPSPKAAARAACGGPEWAEGAFDEAVERGFVIVEEGALVLAWAWPTLGGESPPPSGTAAPTAPEGARVRATDDRAAERRLRALWSRYDIDSPEARVIWVDSPAGLRFLEREGRDRTWALAFTRNAGDNRGRFGCHRTATTHGDNSGDNCGDNHGDNSPPPPAPPTPEKNKKISGNARAPGGNNHGDNSGDNRAGDNPRRQPTATTSDGDNRPRCATVEHLTEIPSAGEVFMHLRGDGKLRLSIATAHEAELARMLEGVTPAWTLDGARRLARHIGAGHLRSGWKPGLHSLRGKDGTWATLLSLYDEALGCERCGAPARPSKPVAPPRPAVDRALLEAEEKFRADRFRASHRKAQTGHEPEETTA